MRIAHISSGDFFGTYGGGQVYVKHLADAMIDMHLDVCIISSTNVQEPVMRSYRGHDLMEIPSGIDLPWLIEVIRLLHPDVIHAHSLKDAVCKAGSKLGIPVVVTAHHGGIICPAGAMMDCRDRICHRTVNHKDCLPCVLRQLPGGHRLWHPLMRLIPQKLYIRLGEWLSKKPFMLLVTPLGCSAKYIDSKRQQWHDIASYATKIIAPCQEMAEILTLNGADSEKVTVIPHGIPLPTVRPPYPEIKNGKIKFYYVGRICYVKGIHVLMEAFSQLKDADIELHMIGSAGNKHERRYMERLQKTYGYDSRIIWHGKVAPEEVYAMTRDFHVAVSTPIYLEAFGLNIAEALALGKPVLSTMSGGGDQQIEEGKNGWLVKSNDAAALTAKLHDIIANAEDLPRMSESCHAIPIAEHVERIIQVYQHLQP